MQPDMIMCFLVLIAIAAVTQVSSLNCDDNIAVVDDQKSASFYLHCRQLNLLILSLPSFGNYKTFHSSIKRIETSLVIAVKSEVKVTFHQLREVGNTVQICSQSTGLNSQINFPSLAYLGGSLHVGAVVDHVGHPACSRFMTGAEVVISSSPLSEGFKLPLRIHRQIILGSQSSVSIDHVSMICNNHQYQICRQNGSIMIESSETKLSINDLEIENISTSPDEILVLGGPIFVARTYSKIDVIMRNIGMIQPNSQGVSVINRACSGPDDVNILLEGVPGVGSTYGTIENTCMQANLQLKHVSILRGVIGSVTIFDTTFQSHNFSSLSACNNRGLPLLHNRCCSCFMQNCQNELETCEPSFDGSLQLEITAPSGNQQFSAELFPWFSTPPQFGLMKFGASSPQLVEKSYGFDACFYEIHNSNNQLVLVSALSFCGSRPVNAWFHAFDTSIYGVHNDSYVIQSSQQPMIFETSYVSNETLLSVSNLTKFCESQSEFMCSSFVASTQSIISTKSQTSTTPQPLSDTTTQSLTLLISSITSAIVVLFILIFCICRCFRKRKYGSLVNSFQAVELENEVSKDHHLSTFEFEESLSISTLFLDVLNCVTISPPDLNAFKLSLSKLDPLALNSDDQIILFYLCTHAIDFMTKSHFDVLLSLYGTEMVEHVSGQTVIFYAVRASRADLVKLFAERGGNVNARDSVGMTPLMVACQHNLVNMINVLAQNGADIELKDNQGWNSLFWAAACGSTWSFQALLHHFPSPLTAARYAVDNQYRTLLDICSHEMEDELSLMLKNLTKDREKKSLME